MKKLILCTMLTLWSMAQHTSTYDFDQQISEIKNSEAYKKEYELATLLAKSQNDPNFIIKVETLLQQNVDPNFKTFKKLDPLTGTGFHIFLYTIENHNLAVKLMYLFFKYKVDPNFGCSNKLCYKDITPLEFLFGQRLNVYKELLKQPQLTDDQKINFIKILLRNGTSIFNTENAKDKRPLTLDQEPLMLRARQELQKEESLALQSLIQEGPRKNVSLFNATRELLGLSAEEFE